MNYDEMDDEELLSVAQGALGGLLERYDSVRENSPYVEQARELTRQIAEIDDRRSELYRLADKEQTAAVGGEEVEGVLWALAYAQESMNPSEWARDIGVTAGIDEDDRETLIDYLKSRA